MNIAIKLAAGCGIGALLIGMIVGNGKSAPPPPSVPLPYDQVGFVRSVATAKSAYKAANNQLAAGGARSSRKQAICNALQGQSATGWVGKIAQLTSNGDGKGVVSIELAPDVHVATWNNALSDIGARTLIEPTSSLFKSLAGMKRGDLVRFSGSFTSSDVDCVREQSVTLDGSMTDPVFTMRFSSVAKL
ncbi:hypothetical protein [Bradyrhizobium glycinis]|uniref:hypothetical protein n=1 Tax=Bradyrhizobium glycinis TaxID=2751812 RepID=UPI0018D63F99|nr:hypothetical protein [Bradyrhizobium glycinis]MBH5372205.1 hypothetical protein [Bradyrhizobium glycinis]